MIKEKLKRGSIPYKLYLYFNILIRYRILKKNKKSFSQFGEDLFINKFFEKQKKGKYVDLGAFHPMKFNNTYLLYKKGWTGTNVDLNPTSIDLFDIARKSDKNLCALLSDQSNIYKNANLEHAWSAVNSIIPHKDLKAKTVMKTEVFENLINHQFDFLNLDLEGHDFKVLQTINLKKFHPKLICIEILEDGKNKENIFNYMQLYDYEFLKNCGPSFFFGKKKK